MIPHGRDRRGAPRPDFELRAVPAQALFRSKGSAAVNVYAIRKDGFTGDITLDDRIRFELLSKRKSGRRSMILFIQASRLARGGDLLLVDSSGALLAGDQPLAPGVALQTSEGKRLPLLCP